MGDARGLGESERRADGRHDMRGVASPTRLGHPAKDGEGVRQWGMDGGGDRDSGREAAPPECAWRPAVSWMEVAPGGVDLGEPTRRPRPDASQPKHTDD